MWCKQTGSYVGSIMFVLETIETPVLAHKYLTSRDNDLILQEIRLSLHILGNIFTLFRTKDQSRLNTDLKSHVKRTKTSLSQSPMYSVLGLKRKPKKGCCSS